MHRAIALALALALFAGTAVIESPAEAAVADIFDEPLRDRPRDDSMDAAYMVLGGIAGVLAVMTSASERAARARARSVRSDPLDLSYRRLPSGPMELGGCSL